MALAHADVLTARDDIYADIAEAVQALLRHPGGEIALGSGPEDLQLLDAELTGGQLDPPARHGFPCAPITADLKGLAQGDGRLDGLRSQVATEVLAIGPPVR